MNKHTDRMKRGLMTVLEIVFVCFAGGVGIAAFVAGFMLGIDAFGRPFVLALALFLVMLGVTAYALGIVDQRETNKRKD